VEEHRLQHAQTELPGPPLHRRRLDAAPITGPVRLRHHADEVDVVARREGGERIERRHRERRRAEEDDPRPQREVAFSISSRV